MNQVVNYQRKLDQLISQLEKENRVPKLLLHSCCAPCSSYCMEYLSNYFHITVFFYNPNIQPREEFERRAKEQMKLIEELPVKYKINCQIAEYEAEKFIEMAKGYEHDLEGGKRCFLCYELRLREAAIVAKQLDYDYFTTTLTISPHKNAAKLNEIGQRLEEEYGVLFLPSDFKKKNGFKRSIELSEEYKLYRQDYCGCGFSKAEAEGRNR